MAGKRGRPPLSEEERQLRRDERNAAARDARRQAREGGRGRAARRYEDDDDERGARSPWFYFMLGVIALFILGSIAGRIMAKRSAQEEPEPDTGTREKLSAGDIEVTAIDGTKLPLNDWTLGFVNYNAKMFKQVGADHSDLEARVTAIEKRKSAAGE